MGDVALLKNLPESEASNWASSFSRARCAIFSRIVASSFPEGIPTKFCVLAEGLGEGLPVGVRFGDGSGNNSESSSSRAELTLPLSEVRDSRFFAFSCTTFGLAHGVDLDA